MNIKQLQSNNRGFTIIEVVLVLAIAGLIFLMVFIALPNLQRGQRDSQRKSDLARIATQIANYSSTTRGSIPSSDTQLATFASAYLNSTDYKDPSSGTQYTLNYVSTAPAASADGTNPAPSGIAAGNIYYRNMANCSDSNPGAMVTVTGNTRVYAMVIYQEGSPKAGYCVDNR